MNPMSKNVFHLEACLAVVKHLLPSQSPIQDFVHHNTLHAFQDQTFEDAVIEAGQIFGARSYLPLEEYRTFMKQGRLSQEQLEKEIRKKVPESPCGEAWIQYALAEYQEFPGRPALRMAVQQQELKWAEFEQLEEQVVSLLREQEDVPLSLFPRSNLIRKKKIDLNFTHPLLFRLIGSYLDQGLTLVLFPYPEKDFFTAVKTLILNSYFPLASYVHKKELRDLLQNSAETVVEQLLNELCPDPALKAAYVQEALLEHPGWSGMVALLEGNPKGLRDVRSIRLVDFLAVKLILESQAIRHLSPTEEGVRIERKSWLLDRRAQSLTFLILKKMNAQKFKNQSEIEKKKLCDLFQWINPEQLGGIFHRAFENTLYLSALAVLQKNAQRNSQKTKNSIPVITAVFCIDDREGSLRHYIESIDPTICTQSTAGFFGLDFLFQSLHDFYPVKSCPVPVQPKHLVKERQSVVNYTRQLGAWLHVYRAWSSSLVLGWLLLPLSAPWKLFKLVLRILHPPLLARLYQHQLVQVESELDFIRDETQFSTNGLLSGYTFSEMAERVRSQLQAMGIVGQLGPLVVMVSHGSSSVNNPHFAAYDCGACSGRPGAPNAKTFAMMANHPEVRKILNAQNVVIPEETHFIGAFHDTCKDVISYFNCEQLDSMHQALLVQFQLVAQQALEKNSKERSRRMHNISLDVAPQVAHLKIQKRSLSLFEPRPEFNHASNAFCTVGRSDFTRGIFLDRRAFIQSYNPLQDESGVQLKGILSAVVPVCAGINLEYLFSRIDNEKYGSGSKLPHNVVSLLGVMNGVDGDLRTGLPRQMIEFHDPVRCLFVVEQTPTVIQKVLKENHSIAQWFDLRWAFLVGIDPSTSELFQYVPQKGFELLILESILEQYQNITSVEEYVSSSRESLPFGVVPGGHC